MKKGFRLVIHKEIPPELLPRAREILDGFMDWAIDGYGTGGWSSRSYYKRGILGRYDKESGLILRRLSKRRRIFGIVYKDQLKGNINWNQCMCSEHLGGTKVKMKDGPYSEDKYNTYFEIGEIKG